MYTSHLAQLKSPGGGPEYHMTRLRCFAMTDTADTCRDGLRAYRNGREWCKEQRDNAINRANERAKGSASSNMTTHQSDRNVVVDKWQISRSQRARPYKGAAWNSCWCVGLFWWRLAWSGREEMEVNIGNRWNLICLMAVSFSVLQFQFIFINYTK